MRRARYSPSPMRIEKDPEPELPNNFKGDFEKQIWEDQIQNPVENDFLDKTLKGRKKKMQKIRNNYLKLLLDPFNAKPCRVPVDIPFQSHIVSDKSTFQITVGTAGDLYGYFAPQFSLRKGNNTEPDWYFATRNTAANSATGTTFGTLRTAANTTPANYPTNSDGQGFNFLTYFRNARLVAAGIKFKYIGRLDATSGYILAGAALQNALPFGVSIPTVDRLNEYMYAKKIKITNEIQCVWFPIDELAKAFANLNSTTIGASETLYSQLVYTIIGAGLPAGQIIDVEVVRHYECVAQPDFVELFGMIKGGNNKVYTLLDDNNENTANSEEAHSKQLTSGIWEKSLEFLAEQAAEWAITALVPELGIPEKLIEYGIPMISELIHWAWS